MGLLFYLGQSYYGVCEISQYSVKFNEKLLDQFSPSRGLQQGDPLSPFLFLFVADALSALLNKAIRDEGLEALKICRRAPAISHLCLQMIHSFSLK